MIFAPPESTHQRMPSARFASVPAPVALSTFAATTYACETPATPCALPSVAAAMPAMYVPWPPSSIGLLSLFTKS